MSSLVIVLSLCAACVLAQPPPPPIMPETFEISGEVEFHGAETTDFGAFVIARDEQGEKGYEREEYDRNGGEVTEALLRYDMNLTYYIRGSKSEPHCLVEDRKFKGIPKFWGFLSYSTYEGTTTVREVEYDLWGTNVGGVRFEFGKPQTNASITYFYRHKSTESSTFYSILDIKATPDPALFEIPQECRDRKKH